MVSYLFKSIRKFHNDEEGLEALQVVMIIAIAALVLIACATVGKKVVQWMTGYTDTLVGNELDSFDESGIIMLPHKHPF